MFPEIDKQIQDWQNGDSNDAEIAGLTEIVRDFEGAWKTIYDHLSVAITNTAVEVEKHEGDGDVADDSDDIEYRENLRGYLDGLQQARDLLDEQHSGIGASTVAL